MSFDGNPPPLNINPELIKVTAYSFLLLPLFYYQFHTTITSLISLGPQRVHRGIRRLVLADGWTTKLKGDGQPLFIDINFLSI